MRRTLVAGAVCLVVGGALSTGVLAKGKPSTEAAQNLSVPAILVGGTVGTLQCGMDLVPPSGTPLTGYEFPGDYWVQKVHTWQAQCLTASAASVFGAWGDNLMGDAKLKAGSPIRVEIVLTNATAYAPLEGYSVIKLQPSLLDRLSAYGHLAEVDAVGGWVAKPVLFDPGAFVVHDAGMKISVQNLDTGAWVVPLQSIAPEINATGKIVYGYNLRVTAAGNYQIRFNTSANVTFTGVDAGTYDANNAYLEIAVIAGGGGGGRPRP